MSFPGYSCLFEIESEDHHIRFHFLQRLGHLDCLRVVDEVGAVMFQDVGEAEAEFHFGVELEEREIEVDAESDGKVEVGGIEHQALASFLAYVVGAHDADGGVRTAVSETVSGDLEVEGKDYVCAFHVLGAFQIAVIVGHGDGLASEIHSGCEPEVEVSVKTEVSEDVDAEAGGETGNFGYPPLSVGGEEAVMGEVEVLHVHADGKSEMNSFQVSIRAVEEPVAGFCVGVKREQACQKCRDDSPGDCRK